jgi:hypothetical protein
MTNTDTSKARTFQTRIKSRACDNFGAVDYTITETITTIPGGVRVEVVTRGMCEGERVDQRMTRDAVGPTMESAAAYRLANGYTEIA